MRNSFGFGFFPGPAGSPPPPPPPPPPPVPVIVQRRATYSGDVNAFGFGVTLPAAPAVGNLLIAMVTAFQGATVGAQWTNSGIGITDDNSGVNRILYRYAQPGDTANFTFGVPGNASFWAASVVELSGLSGVWATDLGASVTGNVVQTTNPFTTTNINTTRENALALCFLECPQATAPAAVFDGAWTPQASISGAGYGAGFASRAMGAPGSGVQATVTWTRAFTASYIALTMEP